MAGKPAVTAAAVFLLLLSSLSSSSLVSGSSTHNARKLTSTSRHLLQDTTVPATIVESLQTALNITLTQGVELVGAIVDAGQSGSVSLQSITKILNKLANFTEAGGTEAIDLLVNALNQTAALVGITADPSVAAALGTVQNLAASVVDAANNLTRTVLGGETGQNYSRHSVVPPRADPLDSLREYRGGFNYSNEHYWASTAWTGAWGYIIGAFFLALLIMSAITFLMWAFCLCCCSSKRPAGPFLREPAHRPLIIVLVTVCACIALAGYIMAWVAYSRYNGPLNKANDEVLQLGVNTGADLREISSVLTNVSATIPSLKSSLAAPIVSINAQANSIETKTNDANDRFGNLLLAIKIGLWITTGVGVLTLIVGVLGAITHWRPLNLSLFFWGLLLSLLAWWLAGLAYFLWKFAQDGCGSMEDYLNNQPGSDLQELIHCTDGQAFSSVAQGAQTLVQLLTPVSNLLSSASAAALTLLAQLACQTSDASACLLGSSSVATSQFITVGQQVADILPLANDLLQCKPVSDFFTTLTTDQCPVVRRNIKLTWVGFILLASSLSLLSLLWVWSVLSIRARRGHVRGSGGKYLPQQHVDFNSMRTAPASAVYPGYPVESDASGGLQHNVVIQELPRSQYAKYSTKPPVSEGHSKGSKLPAGSYVG
eukprot:jgi/Chlat1/3571/Chrsp234S03591